MRFWLGTHMPGWLATVPVDLFVSHRRLAPRRSLPRALGPWALDSGGFTELHLFGGWRTSPADYVTAVRRYRDEIGHLEWASPQDWMVEPFMLARTGLTMADHQRLTVDNYIDLRSQDASLPFIPVLQGQAASDYLAHAAAYERRGVNLDDAPLVGIGSVCRRQATNEAAQLLALLSSRWRLHGFGVKDIALQSVGGWLTSADSMAWSFAARRRQLRLPGCQHATCGNCPRWALEWRDKVIGGVGLEAQQLALGY